MVKKEIIEDLREAGGKLRLYVDSTLSQGIALAVSSAHAHYLLRVMRAKEGDHVSVFNGLDGEWRTTISRIGKRDVELLCEKRIAEQQEVPDVWLAFAPIKKIPADYVTQKATELGVRVLQPVITHRTIARRVNIERIRANAVEAAEQSGRLTIPEIREPIDLPALLSGWPTDRRLIFCDESGQAPPLANALLSQKKPSGPWAILTGPEGGFDDEECAAIRVCPSTLAVNLGPRIMRADTAALAALSIWQAIQGDWAGD
ncbi:MAG: 16S rRNA (uracil(1498)-N(3))-methyltransferase [Micropepsaceae bacterium]